MVRSAMALRLVCTGDNAAPRLVYVGRADYVRARFGLVEVLLLAPAFGQPQCMPGLFKVRR